jgi:hypothetical protein
VVTVCVSEFEGMGTVWDQTLIRHVGVNCRVTRQLKLERARPGAGQHRLSL